MDPCYKRTEAVVTRKIAGETMLIPITSHLADLQQIYALDAVSARIWSLLDGSHNLPDIIAALTCEFQVTETVATTDTRRFLHELHEAGLVEPA